SAQHLDGHLTDRRRLAVDVHIGVTASAAADRPDVGVLRLQGGRSSFIGSSHSVTSYPNHVVGARFTVQPSSMRNGTSRVSQSCVRPGGVTAVPFIDVRSTT